MITKLYNFIKKNIIFFISLIVLSIICFFPLPYYIEAPGGLIDIKDRVVIDNSYSSSGSLNLAYVSSYKATIPTIIYAYFNKDFDILKKEEVIYDNETIKENDFRNKLLLEESKENATIVGFKLAGEDVLVENRKVYITYVLNDALTDLKIGDQVIKINNKIINSKTEFASIIKEYDNFNIEVINNGVTYIRTASKKDGVIGILVSERKDVKTNRKIDFKFKGSESGPSGGFMLSLAIYNYLTENDITNNLKIVGTGTIDEYGTVGAIGGVEYKIKAAVKNKADIFFVPIDNYDEAIKVKNDNNLNINIIKVSTINDAIEYLKNNALN